MGVPRKLSPGQAFDASARSQHDTVDAIEDLRTKQSALLPGNDPTTLFALGNRISVLNESDENVPWYGVLEIGEPRHKNNDGEIINQIQEYLFKDNVYVSGIAPSNELGTGLVMTPVGITQEPINKNGVGEVLVEGITQAKVTISTGDAPGVDEEDLAEMHYAYPIQGDVTRLQLAGFGPIRIIYRKPVFGDEWALVWLNQDVIVGIEVAPDEVFLPGDEENDGDESVECHFADDIREPIFTVWRPPGNFRFGVALGAGGGEGDPVRNGTFGYAVWSRKRSRWELLSLQDMITIEGVIVNGNIIKGNVGDVDLVWVDRADDPGGPPTQSGNIIKVRNWTGPNHVNGENIMVYFDRTEGKWLMVAHH